MLSLASRLMQTLGKSGAALLTKVNSMRKTNSAIHHAVHSAVKEMLEVGGTSLAILLSRVSEISKLIELLRSYEILPNGSF